MLINNSLYDEECNVNNDDDSIKEGDWCIYKVNHALTSL